MCDWFSFGVLLYELQEKAWPFGDEPVYRDMASEFVQPQLLDDDGASEVDGMYGLPASKETPHWDSTLTHSLLPPHPPGTTCSRGSSTGTPRSASARRARAGCQRSSSSRTGTPSARSLPIGSW